MLGLFSTLRLILESLHVDSGGSVAELNAAFCRENVIPSIGIELTKIELTNASRLIC